METTAVRSAATIQGKIADFVVMNFLFGDAEKKPSENDSLIETGIIDSTGILELIEFLESEFQISVSEKETVPQNLGSVAALSRFVEKKLGAG